MGLETDIFDSLGFVLENIDHHDVLKTIQISSIFFVTKIRYSGYVDEKLSRYYDGSFFDNFNDAKAYAESQRKQGAKFKIKQLPCLLLVAEDKAVFITQINTKSPLKGYTADLGVLGVGCNFYYAVQSFSAHSRSWRMVKPGKDSLIFLCHTKPSSDFPVFDSNYLYEWESRSYGPNYFLGWECDMHHPDLDCLKEIVEMTKLRRDTLTKKQVSEYFSGNDELVKSLAKDESFISRFTMLTTLITGLAFEDGNSEQILIAYDSLYDLGTEAGLIPLFNLESIKNKLNDIGGDVYSKSEKREGSEKSLKVSESEMIKEMLSLTKEQFLEMGSSVTKINKVIAEEKAKENPDYVVLMDAFESLYALTIKFNLTPGFDIEKVRKEYREKHGVWFLEQSGKSLQ